MTTNYQLGAEVTFKTFTGKVGIQDTKNAYVGFRAFARIEKTGAYREVLGSSREEGSDLWVQGEYQGAYITHTHDTKDEANRLAWKAYRWLNKGVAA